MSAAPHTMFELRSLEGEDLRVLGRRAGVLVPGATAQDKGWAQRTLKRSCSAETSRARLRTVPLRHNREGVLWPRHALSLCRIDRSIITTPFSQSALRRSLQDLVIVAREDEPETPQRSLLLGAARFDIDEQTFLSRAVEADYEAVRKLVRDGGELHGRVGGLIQPRTKGAGGDLKTFAFYARPVLLAKMLGLPSS